MDENINEELTDKINNFNGITSDMLYDDLIVLDIKSSFDNGEFNKFLVGFLLYHNGSLSRDTYMRTIAKVANSNSSSFSKLGDSLKNKFPDWVGIGPFTGENSNKFLKIYLSIDNKDLHKFANIFLSLSLEKGYNDYDFKINNNESVN